eukprot:gene10235-11285_t
MALISTGRKLPIIIGRPAFKFKFTVALEYLEVNLKNEWRPKCLQLTWSRGQRHREFIVPKEDVKFTKAVKKEIPVEVAECVWEDPMSSTLLVTLYKATEAADFKRKEYVFALEDNLGLTRRKLAVFVMDMSEYVSLSFESQRMEIELKPLSKKVLSVTAGLQIFCEFVKKGQSGDDDMISNFSHISSDEQFRRMTIAQKEDVDLGFEFVCPLQQQEHSNVGILKNRAMQTKSQLLLDLNIAEKSSLTIMRDSDDAVPVRGNAENYSGSSDVSKDDAIAKKQTMKLGKRASLDDQKHADKANVQRKATLGNMITSLRSGVKTAFRRKESLPSPTSMDHGLLSDSYKSVTLPAPHHGSFLHEASNGNNSDYDEYRAMNMKITELQEKNQELCLTCGNLEKENFTLKRDTEELQSEISELHLLVEDLRHQLAKADPTDRNNETKQKKLYEQMNLCGWLCKRGVKGGPIGRRWRRRWFSVDENGFLYYYKENNNEIPQGLSWAFKIISNFLISVYQFTLPEKLSRDNNRGPPFSLLPPSLAVIVLHAVTTYPLHIG